MRLLIVGTLKGQLTTATKIAMDKGASVTHADSIEQALAVLRSGKGADLLMVDVAIDIRELVKRLDAEHIHAPIVACGVTNDARAAVDAIHAGAKEYIPLPPDAEMIAAVLAAVADDSREMIWRDPAMEQVVKLAQQIAGSEASVLITGESGTGKELVARAIHHNSPRRANRFVALNCSAIPETLLEAELFGHVRGAFTGAVANRPGRFEQAHKGTLLLDEVGTMSIALQMKLLRALQEREFEKVGDSRPTKVDVRVIAATNSDLAAMVREGTFREDLYYRLNVIPINLPPLRDRREDIPLLVQHFLERFCRELTAARPIMTVSQRAMRRLMGYSWPGNVRQLENALERAVALSGGRDQIEPGDLPPDVQEAPGDDPPEEFALPEEGIDFQEYVSRVERDLIRQSLERTGGNKGRAAQLLNLKRTTLVEKLKRFNES
jgi:DNA-binding NtrC family response regulator